MYIFLIFNKNTTEDFVAVENATKPVVRSRMPKGLKKVAKRKKKRKTNVKNKPVARPRGRPPLNTAKMDPLIKEDDLLPPERMIETIDTRPVIWHDLPMFAAKYSRTSTDMMYDFGFNTTHQYAQSVKSSAVVPFDIELLLRFYEASPEPCRWNKPDLLDFFGDLYEDIISPYKKNENDEAKIRMALAVRFTTLLGRSPTVKYRWMTVTGESSRRVTCILSKIEEVGKSARQRRKKFESVALAAWRLRGVDVDLVYPIPAPGQLKMTRFSNVSEVIIRRLIDASRSNRKGYAGGAFG